MNSIEKMHLKLPIFIYNNSPIFLQTMLCTLKGLQIKFTRYSRHFHEVFSWLKETEKWSFEQLREYQNQRLRYIVYHCYETVEFYRKQFDSIGLKPQDIEKIEDLKLLPILKKHVVRTNQEKLISRKFKRSSLVRVQTSGTTGAGMEFYHQPETMSFQAAIWWRFRARFDLKISDRHANFGGKPIVPRHQKRPPFWRENYIQHQTYFSSYHLTEDNIGYYVEHLNKQGYVYYIGYPSTVSILAQLMDAKGLRIDKPPKIVCTGSESLLPWQTRLIRKVLGCPVVDQYGAAECICNISKCPEGRYHEDMEAGIIEYEPIKNAGSETGRRIIATGLIDEAMPLLRYEIGDVATITDEQCPCGREGRTVGRIDGRIEDYIMTPDGRRIGRLAYVFANMLNVYESQIIQESVNQLRLLVVKAAEYTRKDEKVFEKKIRDLVGNAIKINFKYVDRIPRGKNGKLRAVISKIEKVKPNQDLE